MIGIKKATEVANSTLEAHYKSNSNISSSNNPKKLLSELDIAYKLKKYPSVSQKYIASHHYTDKTANGLTKMILDYIKFSGGFAERINSFGIYDVKLGRFRPSGSRKGTADISATFKGKSLKIEVKVNGDRMSDAQRRYADEVTAAGAAYFVATDFNSFYSWFENLKICRP